MKIIEKISLIIFANLLLILSVITCLVIFGWVSTEFVFGIITSALNDSITSNIVLGVSIVIILLAIKCIFFDSSSSDREKKDGILLENKEGKLLISKETLETLIASVAKGFEGAESVTSKVILDKENNVTVFVNLIVHPDAIIKDLSNNLQTKIKESIKKTADLDVKEVNIKVKNIAPEKLNIEE